MQLPLPTTPASAVQDWKFADLLLLVQAVHRHRADILHIQLPVPTGLNVPYSLLPLLVRATGGAARS